MCLPVHTVPLWRINPSTSAASSTTVNHPGGLPWCLRCPRQGMIPQGTHVASAPHSESSSMKKKMQKARAESSNEGRESGAEG